MSDKPSRPLIVTTEQLSSPVSISVNFLRRNALDKLSLVQQKVNLQESKGWSSFATGPNNSVFCVIGGSFSLHKISRTLSNEAADAPFESSAKVHHRFQIAVCYICGFECDGEQRLAASFDDKSVRVFRATVDGLSELQQIPSSSANWIPGSLVGLIDGAFCISSDFRDSANSKVRGIELCAADARGNISAPRLLKQFTNEVDLWCISRSAPLCIIAAEYGSKIALRMFHLKQPQSTSLAAAPYLS